MKEGQWWACLTVVELMCFLTGLHEPPLKRRCRTNKSQRKLGLVLAVLKSDFFNLYMSVYMCMYCFTYI